MLDLNSVELKFMPDGLPHLIAPNSIHGESSVKATIKDGNDLLKLSYVRPMLNDYTQLHISYMSAQRMDRQIDELQPFSLKVFCQYINSLKFEKVHIYCPHSDVYPALLDNVVVHDGEEFFNWAIDCVTTYYHGCTIVFPDAGAEKRFRNMKGLKLNEKYHSLVVCSKHRDMATGKITHTEIHGYPKGACLILDDLVDGGRTFTEIAKALANYSTIGDIELAAYHAVLSKGWPIEGITRLFCTDSLPRVSSNTISQYSIM